jgi:hypothetical protein
LQSVPGLNVPGPGPCPRTGPEPAGGCSGTNLAAPVVPNVPVIWARQPLPGLAILAKLKGKPGREATRESWPKRGQVP